MSQTDYTMLHDVPAVMAAIGRGELVEVFIEGTWTLASDVPERIAHDIKFGRQFRIASPSRQAAPADGLSEPPQDEVARLLGELAWRDGERVNLLNLRHVLEGFEVNVENTPLRHPAAYLELVTVSCEFQPGTGRRVADTLRKILSAPIRAITSPTGLVGVQDDVVRLREALDKYRGQVDRFGNESASAALASSPSEPQGSQVVSDDAQLRDELSGIADTLIVVSNNPVASGGLDGVRRVMKLQADRIRAAASALLARRPAQGQVAMLSWSGFNVHGDEARIAEVKRTVHNCGQFDAGFRHPAPPTAHAGASTHAAWPTREEVAEFLSNVCDRSDLQVSIRDLVCIAESVHTKYFASGRDGEGS